MFVGFLGAPNSGKTTVAARVFADLKQSGQPDVEFIAEEARRYMANRKINVITGQLTDEDQYKIFKSQASLELLMSNAVNDTGVVVSDSCAINSFWYMSSDMRKRVLDEFDRYFFWLHKNAILFRCSLLGIMPQEDTLRVHSYEQAKLVDHEVLEFCNSLGQSDKSKIHPNLWHLNKPILLQGTVDHKVAKVLENVYQALTRNTWR